MAGSEYRQEQKGSALTEQFLYLPEREEQPAVPEHPL